MCAKGRPSLQSKAEALQHRQRGRARTHTEHTHTHYSVVREGVHTHTQKHYSIAREGVHTHTQRSRKGQSATRTEHQSGSGRCVARRHHVGARFARVRI